MRLNQIGIAAADYGWVEMGVRRQIGETMDGILMFESVLTPSETGVEVSNITFRETGAPLLSEEVWRFPNQDEFRYTIYRVEGGER